MDAGENMIKNVDGTKMTRRVLNVEKTGFCDMSCRARLITILGVFLDFLESAAECEYAANFTDVKHAKNSVQSFLRRFSVCIKFAMFKLSFAIISQII